MGKSLGKRDVTETKEGNFLKGEWSITSDAIERSNKIKEKCPLQLAIEVKEVRAGD